MGCYLISIRLYQLLMLIYLTKMGKLLKRRLAYTIVIIEKKYKTETINFHNNYKK